MKSIKLVFITFALIFFQKGYSQNENLGHQQTYHFTQQVDNKNVELVITARPGNFLGGETFFHFKLDKIIIHSWEIDGVLYDSQNSNGILPASGELGHAYIDVKISTVAKEVAHNNYWEKKGFQINKMTDFQDIDYEGRKDVWLTYAYVWACTIKSVHVSNWSEIQQKIIGDKTATSSNNNATENNTITNTANADALSKKLDALLSDPNFIQNNPELIQQISGLMRSTDFDNEASVNHYVEEAERIIHNYVGISNTTTATRNSASNQIQQVAKEMNLRSDEVEILEIFSNSENLNQAYSKLQEQNIQSLNQYTLEALNKIVGDDNDFSITGADIQALLNGSSLTDVLKNVNLRQSNKIAQDLGLDYSQTQVLNIIATSDNKEEMTERLKQHNIQQISETTANGLQELLGDSYGSMPITSGDITNMLNGDFDTAIVNMKRNQDINAFTEVLGGDRELATGVYGLLGALAEESNKPKTPEQLQRKFNEKLRSKRRVNYVANDGITISMYSYGNFRLVSYQKAPMSTSGEYAHLYSKLFKSEMYNLDGKLLSETQYETDKNIVRTDFINNTKTRTILDDNKDVLVIADLITGKILVDNTKNTTEIIKNKKGEIIEKKTFNSNGHLHKNEFFDKKYSKIHPSKIINYDNKTNKIKEVIIFNFGKLGEYKVIHYENGVATIEKIYKKGILISENKL